MPTIYQANPGQLIPQPDRTVSTFPSGLVRVDQSFIGLTAYESENREQLRFGNTWPNGDVAPAQDGLFIFPFPKEERTGDGFTKYYVSAYGRFSSNPYNLKLNPSVVKISNGSIYRCMVNLVEGTIVKRSDEVLDYDSLDLPDEILEPYGFYDKTGNANVLSTTYIGETSQEFENQKIKSVWVEMPGGFLIERLRPLVPTKAYSRIWQKYEIHFTTDGVTSSGSTTILISKPTLQILNQRDFGEFIEYDFKTVRETGINSSTLT